MEKLNDAAEKHIMTGDFKNHYIEARSHSYFSGKKPIVGLNIPGFKGYRYPEDPRLIDGFLYQDNYTDDERMPGNFAGFEVNFDTFTRSRITLYDYRGRLMQEALKLGESAVYSILTRFLSDNATEVRFGKKVRFVIEDKGGTWVYEGNGKVNLSGWDDKETISRNGVLLYELNGEGFLLQKDIAQRLRFLK